MTDPRGGKANVLGKSFGCGLGDDLETTCRTEARATSKAQTFGGSVPKSRTDVWQVTLKAE